MDTFEIVVLSIAIILLILVLGTFVYFMTKVDKTSKWPPVVSECPDFWTLKMGNVEDGSSNICVDTNNTIDKKCKSFHADSQGSGFMTFNVSQPSPHFSIVFVRKFSISTSVVLINFFKSSAPSVVEKFIVIQRLFRLAILNQRPTPSF